MHTDITGFQFYQITETAQIGYPCYLRLSGQLAQPFQLRQLPFGCAAASVSIRVIRGKFVFVCRRQTLESVAIPRRSAICVNLCHSVANVYFSNRFAAGGTPESVANLYSSREAGQ